ncbi:aldo/keto reductase [Thermoactinomyces sp. CICC 24226]|uniref:aldo/keto reductase n=1 Tax=Thermoactinomyces sp. CICC 24226 TaxID=2767431 RepID=UPI00351C285C
MRTIALYHKPTAHAVNRLLAKPAVTTVITRAKNKAQVLQNVASSQRKLTREDIARLDKLAAV